MPTLILPHHNRLCIGTKPVFLFWINISTVSEVSCDCQGLGLVARFEASILVFDTKPVLYWPVLGQIQFCSFDRRCKTCLDTKPVLYQGRFCSLTDGHKHDQRLSRKCTITFGGAGRWASAVMTAMFKILYYYFFSQVTIYKTVLLKIAEVIWVIFIWQIHGVAKYFHNAGLVTIGPLALNISKLENTIKIFPFKKLNFVYWG